MTEHIITIQGELTDLNTYINAERGNKFDASKIKKRETERCLCYFLGKKAKGKLDITFNWYCKNLRKDPDNISFTKKFILDGMVKAKFIDNDGHKTINSFCDNFFLDKQNPRVEIILSEVKK